MRMIWIQQLTQISTTLDPQLNLAYLETPSVSVQVEICVSIWYNTTEKRDGAKRAPQWNFFGKWFHCLKVETFFLSVT